jgi:hypothetical protein
MTSVLQLSRSLLSRSLLSLLLSPLPSLLSCKHLSLLLSCKR